MGAASRYLPAFSSSIARSTSGDSVCAAARGATTRTSPSTSAQRIAHRASRNSLRRRNTVDAREVVEDRAPLVRGQSAQLLPRRGTELDRRPRVDLAGRGEHIGSGCRRRLTPTGIVALFLLEGAARVEQTTEELLLARQRARIEPAVVQRLGELPRLTGELRGAITPRRVADLLELIGDVPLLPGERPRQGLARPAVRAVGHAHQPLRLRVDLALPLRHLLHLLDHLGEARRALGVVGPLTIARQRRGGLRQRVGGLAQRTRLLCGLLRGLTIARRHALRSLRHFRLRFGHRARGPRREESALPARALESLARLRHTLFHRALRRAPIVPLRAGARLLLERALLTRELHHLLDGLIELGRELLLPVVDLRLARVLHRLRGALHLGGRFARIALPALLAVARALAFLALHCVRRATHAGLRLLRVLLRLARLRRTSCRLVLGEPLLETLHRLAQPLSTLGEIRGVARLLALRAFLPLLAARLRRRGARRVGERTLLLRQLLRLVAQRLHRPFVRRALQHLGAALELLLQPLLHLRQIAQRIARLLAVHLLRRILELLHLCHELGRERLSQQRLRLVQLAGERRVERTSGLELLLELLRRLAQPLDAVRHLTLLLRERPGTLGALVVHRLLRLLRRAGALRRALPPLRTAVAGLGTRRLIGALREGPLRRRCRTRFLRRGVAQHARLGAALLERRTLDDQVATHATLAPRRRI